MTARDKLLRHMTAAFTLWEDEYRRDPEHFMDAATELAHGCSDLGALRALYMAELMDRVTGENKTGQAAQG